MFFFSFSFFFFWGGGGVGMVIFNAAHYPVMIVRNSPLDLPKRIDPSLATHQLSVVSLSYIHSSNLEIKTNDKAVNRGKQSLT